MNVGDFMLKNFVYVISKDDMQGIPGVNLI